MKNILKNETPYTISYFGVNNLKKDALILAGLIALDATPFIGWITRFTRAKREAQLAMTLAKAIKCIIRIIQLKGAGIIIEDCLHGYLTSGILKPLQAGIYSDESYLTVEMLIQMVSLTDQNGTDVFMGLSVILEPGDSSYISHMKDIYDIKNEERLPWTSVEISDGITIVIEIFEWIQKIIDAVNQENTRVLLTRQSLVRLTNTGQVKIVLDEFQNWVAAEKIPIATELNHFELDPHDLMSIKAFSTLCDDIVADGYELINARSYESYDGLPITVMLPTERGESLLKIYEDSTLLGGWNQTRLESKKGGGLIYLPVMVTPPTLENPNPYATLSVNSGHYWQRQSLHIHAPATVIPGVEKAFRYENLDQNRNIENNRFFNNTMENWGNFTLILERANPIWGRKRAITPAARSVSILNILDVKEECAELMSLETYVKQVQQHNIGTFNEPCVTYMDSDNPIRLLNRIATITAPPRLIPPMFLTMQNISLAYIQGLAIEFVAIVNRRTGLALDNFGGQTGKNSIRATNKNMDHHYHQWSLLPQGRHAGGRKLRRNQNYFFAITNRATELVIDHYEGRSEPGEIRATKKTQIIITTNGNF